MSELEDPLGTNKMNPPDKQELPETITGELSGRVGLTAKGLRKRSCLLQSLGIRGMQAPASSANQTLQCIRINLMNAATASAEFAASV